MDSTNENEMEIKNMSEEELSAPAPRLEREFEQEDAEHAKLERELKALLEEIEALEKKNEALDKSIKRMETELFLIRNPPKYLREMMGF